LQDREGEFGISDIQLGLTTLEEVFLNIAKQAELESSTAEGTGVSEPFIRSNNSGLCFVILRTLPHLS